MVGHGDMKTTVMGKVGLLLSYRYMLSFVAQVEKSSHSRVA